GVQRIARLIDVTEMHRIADLDRAFVGLLLSGDHPEEGGLAGAVRADYTYDAARRQLEREVVDEEIVAKALREPLEIDDVLAEPLGHRDDDLRALGLFLGSLRQQFLIALIARLGFRLASTRRGRDPLLFARHRPL